MRYPALLALCASLAACAGESFRDQDIPITAQRNFQPERYLGLWYEIARFPVFFEEGCAGTTAQYGAIDAETISVINTCREGAPDGPIREIAGSARIVAPGELKVKFDRIPFVSADYWVLWVDEDYQTAVVGVPSGTSGWILARSPEIDAERRAAAEAVLTRNGYDPSLMIDGQRP